MSSISPVYNPYACDGVGNTSYIVCGLARRHWTYGLCFFDFKHPIFLHLHCHLLLADISEEKQNYG